MSATIAINESNRLQALYDYEILDTPPEKCFDDLLEVAATVCNAPYAAISFIDNKRQWFKSKVGMDISETPREVAFCSHTILYSDLFYVKDASNDERFATNPLVVGPPHIKFYAGMPITTSDGFNLGTICILDILPRDLADHQKRVLELLAGQVLSQCDLKRNKTVLDSTQKELTLAFSGLVRAHTNSAVQQEMLNTSEQMSNLGEMSSSIVHEIANPLAILQMKTDAFRDLILNGSLSKEKLLDFCTSIEKNILRMTSIFKAVRSLARKADNDPYVPVGFKAIMEDVLQLCEKRLSQNSVQLKIGQIPEDLILECREGQIAQILINLVNNAADAISDLKEKWVAVDFRDLSDQIEITVTDSGKGIPPEIRAKMFQPFYTTKALGKGTGLGLSISRRVLESHHGSMRINSDYPNTQFVVTLPKKQTAHQANAG